MSRDGIEYAIREREGKGIRNRDHIELLVIDAYPNFSILAWVPRRFDLATSPVLLAA